MRCVDHRRQVLEHNPKEGHIFSTIMHVMARYRGAATCAALGLAAISSHTSFVPNNDQAGGSSSSSSFAAVVSAFAAHRAGSISSRRRPPSSSSPLFMTSTEKTSEGGGGGINYNAVYVPKSGGVGVKSASEMMGVRGASARGLGAPPPRLPPGGRFFTAGGVEIDATVRPLRYTHGDDDGCGDPMDDGCDAYVPSFFSSEGGGGGGEGEEEVLPWGSDGAIERLVDLLDRRKGAVLTSSYEFPGR
jgi:hypothetical protein